VSHGPVLVKPYDDKTVLDRIKRAACGSREASLGLIPLSKGAEGSVTLACMAEAPPVISLPREPGCAFLDQTARTASIAGDLPGAPAGTTRSRGVARSVWSIAPRLMGGRSRDQSRNDDAARNPAEEPALLAHQRYGGAAPAPC
jgi:hypothetical protein